MCSPPRSCDRESCDRPAVASRIDGIGRVGFAPGDPGYNPVVDDNTDESLLDRLRGTGVGVEDPNIVGDVGPTDIPPGSDGEGDGLFADLPDPADSLEPPDLLDELSDES